jgi:hypothetical protein
MFLQTRKFLLRKLFSNPFPPPSTKVYNEINIVIQSFPGFLFVKSKEKHGDGE